MEKMSVISFAILGGTAVNGLGRSLDSRGRSPRATFINDYGEVDHAEHSKVVQ
jgi:hypothetical protein